MLVMSRKVRESIQIGNDVVVTVTLIKPDAVRIGITAPRDVKIVRTELISENERGADCGSEMS